MCQLLGAVGQTQNNLTNVLRIFAQGSQIHKHGWGLAHLMPEETRIIKAPEQADQSPLFAEILKRGFWAQNAFVHLRYATVGDIDAHNTHPFSCRDNTGREWVLMHQGTLFDFNPASGYFYTQSGNTDSERILLYLVDQINTSATEHGGFLNAAQRFDVLDTEIRKMAPGNKLNLAIYDAEQIYLHSNYKNSLYLCNRMGTLIFCTYPLLDTETWHKLPLNSLYALKDGKIVKSGTPHNSTYIDTEEDIKRLYEIYAGL